MVLVYDLAHRRNDVEKNGTEYFSRENMLEVAAIGIKTISVSRNKISNQ
jgi:hypothetical protein